MKYELRFEYVGQGKVLRAWGVCPECGQETLPVEGSQAGQMPTAAILYVISEAIDSHMTDFHQTGNTKEKEN